MTDSELLKLRDTRNAALASQMDPLTLAEHYQNSVIFRSSDAAIVRELVRRNAPARLGEVTLRLTADRLNFVEVDPATGIPIYSDRPARSALYRYPEPASVG